MKSLIVYYSFSGNNEKLAKELQHRLRCDVLQIVTVSRRTKFSIFLDLLMKRKPAIKEISTNVPSYDHIILVAPIWGGQIAAPMKSFILQERNHIANYSFISLCSGVAGQKAKLQDALERLTGKKASVVEELWVNDLMPPEKKDKIKYVTGYQVKPGDWNVFNPGIQHFLNTLR